jgi:excinuclease ABC subunit C
LLKLDKPPARIEGFDISNTMGNQSVASLVVWDDGEMKQADYRRFRIHTVEGANDFASMQEAVRRRYAPSGETTGDPGESLPKPDLILIDGGPGQLAAAQEGLRQAGCPDIALFGLAKARGEKDERMFVPGRKNPILLRGTSPATHLVQRIRDEAHRFAVTYHRKLRGKALLASALDRIAGVGEVRRRRLLRRFASLDRLAAATDAELHEAAGIDSKTADRLREALRETPIPLRPGS